MRGGIVSLLVFLGVSLSGCGPGTREATLIYPPLFTADRSPTAHATTHSILTQETIVIDFMDRRSTMQQVVGGVRNSSGAHVADVIATNSVLAWVADAVKSELETAGYAVARRDAMAPSPSDAFLSVEILTVFSIVRAEYHGEVSVIANLLKDGRELIKKRYYGKGTAGSEWVFKENAHGQALALALSDAVKQLVHDIKALEA